MRAIIKTTTFFSMLRYSWQFKTHTHTFICSSRTFLLRDLKFHSLETKIKIALNSMVSINCRSIHLIQTLTLALLAALQKFIWNTVKCTQILEWTKKKNKRQNKAREIIQFYLFLFSNAGFFSCRTHLIWFYTANNFFSTFKFDSK